MDSFFSQKFILILLASAIIVTIAIAFFYLKYKNTPFYRKEKSKRLQYLLTLVITIVSLTITIVITIKDQQSNQIQILDERMRLQSELLKLQKKSIIFNRDRDSLYSMLISKASDNIKNSETSEYEKILALRITKIETEFKSQKEITTALRQAINPIKPEEVLTIARLKDEVTELNKSITLLNENLKIRQQNFEDSIKREISSSNSSTSLILAILVPLVFNFLYNFWKDFKRPQKDFKEE